MAGQYTRMTTSMVRTVGRRRRAAVADVSGREEAGACRVGAASGLTVWVGPACSCPARPRPAASERVHMLRGRALASCPWGCSGPLQYVACCLTPHIHARLQLGPGGAARQLRGGVRHGAGGGGVREAAAAVLPSHAGGGGGLVACVTCRGRCGATAPRWLRRVAEVPSHAGGVGGLALVNGMGQRPLCVKYQGQ